MSSQPGPTPTRRSAREASNSRVAATGPPQIAISSTTSTRPIRARTPSANAMNSLSNAFASTSTAYSNTAPAATPRPIGANSKASATGGAANSSARPNLEPINSGTYPDSVARAKARKERNRIAAQRSRDRKRDELNALDEENQILKHKVENLRETIWNLENELGRGDGKPFIRQEVTPFMTSANKLQLMEDDETGFSTPNEEIDQIDSEPEVSFDPQQRKRQKQEQPAAAAPQSADEPATSTLGFAPPPAKEALSNLRQAAIGALNSLGSLVASQRAEQD